MAETIYSDIDQGNIGNIINVLKSLNLDNPIIFKEFFKPPLDILAENDNKTPLTIVDGAAYRGDIEILKLIREELYDKNPHVKSSAATSGATPLHWAARQDQLQIVIYLAECLIDKNPPNDIGLTPMHWAAEKGNLQVIEYYLRILPNGKKNPMAISTNYLISGRTVLHEAAGAGHLSVVEAISNHLIDINPASAANSFTPLHMAASKGRLNIVKFYVERLDNINPETNLKTGNSTPLHIAAIFGHLEVVKYLSQEVGTPDLPDLFGMSTLHYAAMGDHLNVVKYLTENLIDPEVRDFDGQTPLHMAARSGHLDVVKYLSKKVNDQSIIDNHGDTPCEEAVVFGHSNVVSYLQQFESSCGLWTNSIWTNRTSPNSN